MTTWAGLVLGLLVLGAPLAETLPDLEPAHGAHVVGTDVDRHHAPCAQHHADQGEVVDPIDGYAIMREDQTRPRAGVFGRLRPSAVLVGHPARIEGVPWQPGPLA